VLLQPSGPDAGIAADGVDGPRGPVGEPGYLADEHREALDALVAGNGDRQAVHITSLPSLPSLSQDPWPDPLDPGALHGIAGEITTAVCRTTEADPAGVLLTVMVNVGVAIGPGPALNLGGSSHHVNEFAVNVGRSARARKGTSWDGVEPVMCRACPDVFPARVKGGFGSGEKVVDELVGTDDQPADPRLLVFEGEFARLLSVKGREGSTMGHNLRHAWDGKRLEVRSRSSTSVCDHHHVGIVGHITRDELAANLTAVDAFSGFANRFLWVLVHRQKVDPFATGLDRTQRDTLASKLQDRISAARRHHSLAWHPDARPLWEEIYRAGADDDPPGLLGHIVSRSEPHTARLAAIYALLDGTWLINVEHLAAARAVWRYCRQSAAILFDNISVDHRANKVLDAIRAAGGHLARLAIQGTVFSNHIKARDLDQIRDDLVRMGSITVRREQTDGRPAEIWTATR
jgi:hypothetical protein